MKLKKKILVLGLCGVMSVFPVMSVSAVGEDGIVPLAEACPQCSLGNFVFQGQIVENLGREWEKCDECGKHLGKDCNCVWVEYTRYTNTYTCDRCGFSEDYSNLIGTVLRSCPCTH